MATEFPQERTQWGRGVLVDDQVADLRKWSLRRLLLLLHSYQGTTATPLLGFFHAKLWVCLWSMCEGRREGVCPLYWTIGSYEVKCLQSNVWSALGEGLLSRAEYEGRRAEGHWRGNAPGSQWELSMLRWTVKLSRARHSVACLSVCLRQGFTTQPRLA